MDSSKLQLIFAGAATASACIASVYDVRERRIPNWLTAPILMMGLAAHAMTAHWRGLGEATAAAFLGGTVFLLFHIAGGMGAGDVKLMAACAGVVGLPALGTLLISTGICGALFAICVSLVRGVFRQSLINTYGVMAHHRAHGLTVHPEFNLRSGSGIRLPFAVPIAAGCAFTLIVLAVHA
jgi:prepilin peptidase CpaA